MQRTINLILCDMEGIEGMIQSEGLNINTSEVSQLLMCENPNIEYIQELMKQYNQAIMKAINYVQPEDESIEYYEERPYYNINDDTFVM